ncbi:uncharacterized protein K02A2.6-like [Actinia tenebrosa]|uniref:Uncharacterized protein K02A2.6-like n=1 Tax=Actinia tenebrosa TaxID=6105 RepID=A0A6P8HGH3_ACTTE|nr:uncharacterized protein K02A2.6-like [Actinia tenebrosa]
MKKKQVPTTASPRVQRWAVTLRGYDYTIQYRAGKENGNADAFSRLPLPVSRQVQEEDRVLLIQELEGFPLTAEQIRTWTQRDPVLAHVKEYLLRGWPDDSTLDDPLMRPYQTKKLELSVHEGCVLWGARVVIPPVGREQVLKELHQAHPGINRMKGLARSYVWWPSMDKDLENLVQQCETCQVHRKAPAAAPLHPWEWPDQPWKRLHMDYAGPFMGQMFLVVVDAHSKWINAEIMSSTTSAATISKLRAMFATHGLPEVVVSDNGSNFTSQEMEEFLTQNGIVHVTSAPYHPATNGLAERAVQTIKEGLKKVRGDSIETRLQKLLFNYRITPQTTTGKSPAEALMGRKLRCRLDLLHPNLQGKVQQKQSKMKEVHDRQAHPRVFTVGNPVYVRNFGSGLRWIPWVIQETTGPLSYTVTLMDGRGVRRHIDHVRSRHPEKATGSPPQGDSVVITQEVVKDGEQKVEGQDNHVMLQSPRDVVTLATEPLPNNVEERPTTSCDAVACTEVVAVPHERYPRRERRQPAYLRDYEQ